MKKLEVILKNFLLRILLLLKFQAEKQNIILNENSKILFIRLNRIGDALITTPLFHFIKETINAKIFLLADLKNYFVFENNPYINDVIIFRKGISGLKQILKFIREMKIDVIVDLHDDVSTTVSFIVALSRVPVKIGLEKANKSIFTHTVKKPDPEKNHVIKRILEIARPLVSNFDNEIINFHPNIEIFPSKESLNLVDKFISNNFTTEKKLAGINISAGSKARFWGVEKYKNVIDFLSGSDLNILILSSPEYKNQAEEISEGKYKIFSSDKFEDFEAIISKLKLLFTPDTAAVHLASAYEVPVFGLYVKYKTNDMIWSPYKSKFDCVVTEEANLDNVSFEEVIPKLKNFLKKL